MALVFVDVEALGTSPVNGTMTEFGAVVYDPNGKNHKKSFHGKLFEGTPNPDNPAVPIVGERINSSRRIAILFTDWLKEVSPGQVTLVSDNPAYDFMWIAGFFDEVGMENPFGHSGRRISDFYAGMSLKWGNTQEWKRWRITPHTHNPVDEVRQIVDKLTTDIELMFLDERTKEVEQANLRLETEFGEDWLKYKDARLKELNDERNNIRPVSPTGE